MPERLGTSETQLIFSVGVVGMVGIAVSSTKLTNLLCRAVLATAVSQKSGSQMRWHKYEVLPRPRGVRHRCEMMSVTTVNETPFLSYEQLSLCYHIPR